MTTLTFGTSSAISAFFILIAIAIAAIISVIGMVSGKHSVQSEEQHLVSDQEPTETTETKTETMLEPAFFVNLCYEALANTDPIPGKYRRIASYRMEPGRYLTICYGSVVDFESSKGIIVNATNEEGLGGSGVDGAISEAGGPSLALDREALPVTNGVRCPTSQAVLLGPKQYGNLKTPYVALTVGPDFTKQRGLLANNLLGDCYTNVLAATQGHDDIEQVAFCLVSAGKFRGEHSLDKIAEAAVVSIYAWAIEAKRFNYDTKVTDVVLFVYKKKELKKVMAWADNILEGCIKVHVA